VVSAARTHIHMDGACSCCTQARRRCGAAGPKTTSSPSCLRARHASPARALSALAASGPPRSPVPSRWSACAPPPLIAIDAIDSRTLCAGSGAGSRSESFALFSAARERWPCLDPISVGRAYGGQGRIGVMFPGVLDAVLSSLGRNQMREFSSADFGIFKPGWYLMTLRCALSGCSLESAVSVLVPSALVLPILCVGHCLARTNVHMNATPPCTCGRARSWSSRRPLLLRRRLRRARRPLRLSRPWQRSPTQLTSQKVGLTHPSLSRQGSRTCPHPSPPAPCLPICLCVGCANLPTPRRILPVCALSPPPPPHPLPAAQRRRQPLRWAATRRPRHLSPRRQPARPHRLHLRLSSSTRRPLPLQAPLKPLAPLRSVRARL